MAIQLPWIGYRDEMKYKRLALQEAGFNIESTINMEFGLTLIQRQTYPVVIVQDWSPTGELELSAGIAYWNSPSADPTRLTYAFLKKVRSLSNYRLTPIVIPHFLDNEDAKRLQLDNSVELIDLVHSESVTGCMVDAVRKHI